MKLNYEEFKKNPSRYVFFSLLVAVPTLFFIMRKDTVKVDSLNSKQIDVLYKMLEEKEQELKQERLQNYKQDSITHHLYELLGAKKVLDKLKQP